MYDLEEIRLKALDLMAELGDLHLGESLLILGWTLAFNNARTRLGVCRWMKKGERVKVIVLSRHYARECGWDVMGDVVRHEIAHAIEFEMRGDSNHGDLWKELATALGADPTRRYERRELPYPTSKYVGICPSCGKEHPFYRPVRRTYGCTHCCRQLNGGRFDERFHLKIVERATRRELPSALKNRRLAKYTALCPNCGKQRAFRRKLKHAYACRSCCEAYADGRFDARFAWVVTKNY